MWCKRCRTVHPHGRGDNALNIAKDFLQHGSPPRAWGQLIEDKGGAGSGRFTPTGVGTTLFDSVALCVRAVHPHGRGDNQTTLELLTVIPGSPPRAWGQRRRRGVRGRGRRFTPTGVGTTWPTRRVSTATAVHPHGRGDNVIVPAVLLVDLGSPPRAWGQLGMRRLMPHLAPVHPHGRGDNVCRFRFFVYEFGSPPRAWGQHLLVSFIRRVLRFTPTGVGTTF